MKKLLISLICLMLLSIFGDGKNLYAQNQSFDLRNFVQLVGDRIKTTGARDTISSRVPKGESCVEASLSRAVEVSYVIRSMQMRNQFGPYGARVGTVSGWNPGIGSIHTYTVVEILNNNGKVIHTLDVDNYLGKIYISNHGPVNWNSVYTHSVDNIAPFDPSTYIAKTKAMIIASSREKPVAENTTFKAYPGLDSPGNDLIPWSDPSNFGWTPETCKVRCAKEPRCMGAGWDPNQKNYCTMKTVINFPLRKWTSSGILFVKGQ